VSNFLFPSEPRAFKRRRETKIALRAVHVLCAGVLTGAYLLGAEHAVRMGWLWATIATGSAILLVDLHETAVFLVQTRGFVVMGKIVTLALLPHLGEAAGYALAVLVLVSVVVSHAPGAVRYRIWIARDRLTGSETKG
jgi:hypothetical protein